MASAMPVGGAVFGAGNRPDTPPFSLPGRHFAAGLAFWAAGAVGLVVAAPELAAGLYPLPLVLGVTHLFTLGWITTSIMGALYQFLPVALGVGIRSQGLAKAVFVVYVPGLALFVYGLLENAPVPRLVGAGLFGTGLLLFAVNLGLTLRQAARRDVTWWSLAGATLFLASTVLLGAVLAVNLGNGMLGGSRGSALAVHLHLALFGWVLLVMIGVARHLLPMFLLSPGTDVRLTRWAAAGVSGGSLVLLLLHHAPAAVSHWVPGVLLATGGMAFLAQVFVHYRRRRRPQLDPGMRLAAGGIVLLGLGLLQAPWALAGGAGATRAWTGYVGTVILGISLFVAAHYYKIVPFLVWFHRYGPLAGRRPLPRVSELYDARLATLATTLLALGAAGVALGAGLGGGLLTRAGAVGYSIGVFLEAVQMGLLARRRPA